MTESSFNSIGRMYKLMQPPIGFIWYVTGNMWIFSRETYLEMNGIFDECPFSPCDIAMVLSSMRSPSDWLIFYEQSP